MTTTRQQFLALMFAGLRKVFYNTYKQQTLVHPRIYQVEKSSMRQEDDHTVPGFGMLTEKPEGTSIVYEDMVDGYDKRYIHTSYAKGTRITRELIDDDQYGIIKKRVQALGRSARYRKEYDHALLFNTATATTYFTGADGLALLSASHTLAAKPGQVVSNTAGATALSLSAIETAFDTFRRSFVDDQGLLISIEPKYLLIPPELRWDANEILNSNGKVNTADNNLNPVKGLLEVIEWPFLTDTNAWFILADKSDGFAPMSFDRVPVEYDSDGDFDSKDLKNSVYTRYSNGFTDWRWVYGGTGAS